MIDGLLRCEDSRCHTVVHVLSLKPDPMTLPACTGVRVIAVPFSGKEQEHVAGFDRRFRTMGTLEDTLAFGVVEQLVFVKHSAFLGIEIIAIGMSLCRIVLTRRYFFISHSTDGQSPQGITFVCYR